MSKDGNDWLRGLVLFPFLSRPGSRLWLVVAQYTPGAPVANAQDRARGGGGQDVGGRRWLPRRQEKEAGAGLAGWRDTASALLTDLVLVWQSKGATT